MESFSVYIIPVVICIIIVFGLFKRVPLFDTFIAGAKKVSNLLFLFCLPW